MEWKEMYIYIYSHLVCVFHLCPYKLITTYYLEEVQLNWHFVSTSYSMVAPIQVEDAFNTMVGSDSPGARPVPTSTWHCCTMLHLMFRRSSKQSSKLGFLSSRFSAGSTFLCCVHLGSHGGLAPFGSISSLCRWCQQLCQLWVHGRPFPCPGSGIEADTITSCRAFK